MTAREWAVLIAREFGCSKTQAKSMYHIMIRAYRAYSPIKNILSGNKKDAFMFHVKH